MYIHKSIPGSQIYMQQERNKMRSFVNSPLTCADALWRWFFTAAQCVMFNPIVHDNLVALFSAAYPQNQIRAILPEFDTVPIGYYGPLQAKEEIIYKRLNQSWSNAGFFTSEFLRSTECVIPDDTPFSTCLQGLLPLYVSADLLTEDERVRMVRQNPVMCSVLPKLSDKTTSRHC